MAQRARHRRARRRRRRLPLRRGGGVAPALAVLGTPGERRVEGFLAAAARAGLPAPAVLTWADFLDGAPVPDVDLLRVDSPGQDHGVRARLVALGAGDPTLRDEPDDPGRIWRPRGAWRGLTRALRRLRVPLTIDPDDVTVLFDKAATQARLVAAGVPVPEPLGTVGGFDALLSCLDTHGVGRAFVKLRHGSSASGVLAVERAPGRLQAYTTARLAGDRVYNHLRPCRYRTVAEVRAIVDALGPEGLHVERWVPKAGVEGHTFDLRILAIGGRARHTVVRMARGPLTNLHLGNRRGSLDAVARRMGLDAVAAARAAAEQAAAAFPGMVAVGVDVLIAVDGRPFVAEVNAFGDLLPGVRHEGEDPWEAQLSQVSASGRY